MTGLLQPESRCTAWWYAQYRGMRKRDQPFLMRLGKRAASLARQQGAAELPKTWEEGYWVFWWPWSIWEQAWPETDPRCPQERQFWEAHLGLALPDLTGFWPQYEISLYGERSFTRYFLDFAIPGQRGGFAVEIDGFGTHATREAQTRDNQRQRDLHRNGWHVERYTAQEVHRDAGRWVQDAARLASQWRRRMP